MKKDGDSWSWQRAKSLNGGQVFHIASYSVRLIQLPSGALIPIMQDVTFGIPTGFLERNKYYIRCEDYQTSNVE